MDNSCHTHLADDGWEQLQALAYFNSLQALAIPVALWIAAGRARIPAAVARSRAR